MSKVIRVSDVLTKKQILDLKEINEISLLSRNSIVVLGYIPSGDEDLSEEENEMLGALQYVVNKPFYFIIDNVDQDTFLENVGFSREDILIKLLKK